MLIYIIIMTDTLKNKMIKCLPVELTHNIIMYNLIKTSRKIILRRMLNNFKKYYINYNGNMKCEICRNAPVLEYTISRPYPYRINYYGGSIITDNALCFKCNNILELNETFKGHRHINKHYALNENTYNDYYDLGIYDEYLDDAFISVHTGEWTEYEKFSVEEHLEY